MARYERLLGELLRGEADANFAFEDLRGLLRHLGFSERQRGSHHIFRQPGIPELLNLQRDGSKAKLYQVRQVRALVLRHGLHLR